MKLVYIAGPYRASTPFEVSRNIARARLRAEEAVSAGNYPIVPHSITAFMDGAQPDKFFLDGGVRLMLRGSDEVWLVEGWERSAGTLEEIKQALRANIPVFDHRGQRLFGVAWEEGGERCRSTIGPGLVRISDRGSSPTSWRDSRTSTR